MVLLLHAFRRFWKNGVDLGEAYFGLARRPVIPAVCLRSDGVTPAEVEIVSPSARTFYRSVCPPSVLLDSDGVSARGSVDPPHTWPPTWSTLPCQHPGVFEGVVPFSFRFDAGVNGDGFAIGVLDAACFNLRTSVMGRTRGAHAWCLLASGQTVDDSGVHEELCKPLAVGDIVTMVVDADRGAIMFEVNGASVGTASFSSLVGRCLLPAVTIANAAAPELTPRISICVYVRFCRRRRSRQRRCRRRCRDRRCRRRCRHCCR